MPRVFDSRAICPAELDAVVPRYRDAPEPIALVFGTAVRAARTDRGWTLEDLGSRMGRPDGKYLGEVERGFHSPTITTAKMIADALEVRLADLVADL